MIMEYLSIQSLKKGIREHSFLGVYNKRKAICVFL